MANSSTTTMSNIVRNYISLNWNATNIVQYTNIAIQPNVNEPFIYFEILPDLNKQKSIGALNCNLQLLTGLLFFRVVVKSNSGEKDLHTITDAIATLFKNKDINGVVTFGISYSTANTDATGNWLIRDVTVPFEYEYNE